MASIMAMSHTAIYVLLTRTFTGCKFETRGLNGHALPPHTRPTLALHVPQSVRPHNTAPPMPPRPTPDHWSGHHTMPTPTLSSASRQPHGTAPCLRAPPCALPHPRTPLLRLTPVHHPTHALCHHGPALHRRALIPVHHPMPRLALALRTRLTPPPLAMCHSHWPHSFATSHPRAKTAYQSHATTNSHHRATAFGQPCATANGALPQHFPI